MAGDIPRPLRRGLFAFCLNSDDARMAGDIPRPLRRGDNMAFTKDGNYNMAGDIPRPLRRGVSSGALSDLSAMAGVRGCGCFFWPGLNVLAGVKCLSTRARKPLSALPCYPKANILAGIRMDIHNEAN